MEFKKLEIKKEPQTLKRWFQSAQFRRTLKAIGIGMAAGLLYFYLTEGRQAHALLVADWVKSALIGGFFGFWFTNSPCARGNCQR